MRRHLAEVVLLALAVVFLTGLGLAQERLSEKGDTSIMVNIPFPFYVENTQLPAGKYKIERVATWDFVISSPGHSIVANFATEPTEMPQAPTKARASFNVYGDKIFLSKIWYADNAYGYRLNKSWSERSYMKMEATKMQEVSAEKK